MYNIILGSGSPRRHEILTLAGIEHAVIVPEADECKIHYVGDCQRYVKELAKLKSDSLTELLKSDEYKTKIDFSDTVTICADTVVFSPKKPYPLGKPKNFDDACDMLKAFSGTYHYVLTGVCIRKNPTSEIIFTEETKEILLNLYQISEQSDNNGWKGRKCLNTNSQKFCKKSFLRIHCQIDSGCHSKRNGE